MSSNCSGKEKKENVHDEVQEYYGKLIQKTTDLKTDACTTSAKIPSFAKPILSSIHDEVLSKYYGCGVVIPQSLEGAHILDLGSGSGRDVYLMSKLVGPSGFVVGVDMTEEQLDVARRHVDYHTQKYGYSKANVDFKKGYIEKLNELGLEEGSFDLVISNCVINLSPDKESVLRHAFKLLKSGGEIFFSDVYSDRRMPTHLAQNSELWGECLSGALYWNDFLRLCRKVGFSDPRLVESAPISVKNERLEKLLGNIKFWSATYRLFKIDQLEDSCEDYGEAVQYKGGMTHYPHAFELDGHHLFEVGKVMPVCRNTRLMLSETRFNQYFNFFNTKSNTHYGIYKDCGTPVPFQSASENNSSDGGGCC